MSLLDRLAALQLVVVTGKGGTGKSVMATALGHVLAARGRRTLLLEVDPRENLHHLCAAPPSGGEIVAVAPRLWLQNLKPGAVADWVVEKQVKIRLLVKRVLASPVYHRFVEGAPGLTEIAIIGHALRTVRGDLAHAPAIDTVVLDAPATGHGVFLLTAARLYGEAIGEGPFARLAHEVAELVDSVERTGIVVVTLAEEMPVQEALELRAALAEKLGRTPEVLVTNAVYPPLEGGADGDPSRDLRRGDPLRDLRRGDPLRDLRRGDPLRRLWRDRRRVNDKELARLTARWPGPRIELPLLPIDEGPELVAALTRLLGDALAGLEAA